MKRRCPLRLHQVSFFSVDVADDTCDPVGRAVQAADDLRRGAEPPVLTVPHFQPIFNGIFCLVGFVRNRLVQQRKYTVFILGVQKICPSIQLIREIQRVMIPQKPPVRMAPIYADDFPVFIAVKIPQGRADGLVHQGEVLKIPIHMYRHHPKGRAVCIGRVFFVQPHTNRGAVCRKNLPLALAMDLTKALVFEKADIFPVKKSFQRTARLLHKGGIAVAQIVQQQVADRQN